MNEKYYTPHISEFHVGFEYEYKSIDENWSEDTTNHEMACDLECDPIYKLKEDLRNGQVRVKSLDRRDIEELGWKVGNEYGAGVSYLTDNHFRMDFSKYANIHGKDYFKIFKVGALGTYLDTDNLTPVFSGKIKNKSELKKLMQMLNITQEINYGKL